MNNENGDSIIYQTDDELTKIYDENERINMKNLPKVTVENFDDWNIYEGAAEGSGASEKIWLEKDGQIGLFKYPKLLMYNGKETQETTKEFLSEKLAYLIAQNIDVETAKVDIGTRNGRIGSMSYKIPQNLEILMEGIIFISSYMPNYNQNELYNEETKEYYSLKMIENSIKEAVNYVPQEFYKMLIFDFIIGNSDRHHSNWAFIVKANSSKNDSIEFYGRFSPLYDNGSSLCAFEKDEDVLKYIKTKDKMLVNSLIDSKSKSMIRIDPKIKKRPTQLEFIKYLKKFRYNNIIDYVNEVIEKLDSNRISNIINMFDDNIMTVERKKLLNLYLNKKIELLKDVFWGEEN